MATHQRFYCPIHEIAFTLPLDGRRVVCPSGGHVLREGETFKDFWEHCNACGTFWPQGSRVADACPTCRKRGEQLYVCHACNLVTLWGEGSPAAFCVGCKATTPRPPVPHACTFANKTLWTCRNQCPYCDASLAPPAVAIEPTIPPGQPRPTAPRREAPTSFAPVETVPITAPVTEVPPPNAHASRRTEWPARVEPFRATTETMAPQPERKSAFGKVALSILGALILAVGCGLTGYMASRPAAPDGSEFTARITSVLAKSDLSARDIVSLKELYMLERARYPSAAWVRRAEGSLKAAFEAKADKWIALRTKYGTDRYAYPPDLPFTLSEYMENAYDLLQEIEPANQGFRARHRYLRAKRKADDDVKDYDGALADYQEALQLEPNWALVLNDLGNLYVAKESWPLRDFRTGTAYFRRAIEVDPNFVWSYKNLGNYYRDFEQDYATARAYFERSRERYPEYPDTVRDIGDTYKREGDCVSALPYLEEAKRMFLERDRKASVAAVDRMIGECGG
jgi:tetratricopeptide (TPR) repeat protein